MSRQKSEKTIARECEQAIRRTRRALKRESRARLKAELAERRRRRANARNCDLNRIAMKKETFDERGSFVASLKDNLLASIYPFLFCERCKTFKRRAEFSDEALCDHCAYSDIQEGESQ